MIEQPLFQQALPILERLESAGYEAYFVGGCVRDSLLGKPISDIDIATSAFPEEIKTIFKRTIDVGIEHGTVMVLLGQESYEVTTFRTESTYQDYRRPDKVVFVRSLAEDLKRRDFTINALALDCRGRLYDFHNGQQDLAQGYLRAVGQADERFHEDALRMMRAVRFAGQLSFKMATQTQAGIKKNAHLLEKIAVERITVEFLKLLASKGRAEAFQLFLSLGLYQYCPQLKDYETQLVTFAKENIIFADDVSNWTVLLYYLGITADKSRAFMKKWKVSNQDLADIACLLSVLEWRQHQNWSAERLFAIGLPLAQKAEDLASCLGLISEKEAIEPLYTALPIHSVKDLALNGKDIMLLLKKDNGGPYLGQLIEQMKKAVLNGHLHNSKEALSEWVQHYFS